ncbi:ZIP family metal transporter [Candidatus Curtissbacteria bacterium]|nr:ZIP family metal transporter [Candidatus Curtissbacteria bacterium]
MPILVYILIFSFIGSVVSLIGGLALLIKEKLALSVSHLIASFAAGALLGAAFLDLLPEASMEGGKSGDIFLWALGGMLAFFLLERFVRWFHHHHEHLEVSKPTVSLIMVGDTIHNFIDGVAIAATFLVSVPLGMVTTFAVAAHEIPQEIGDFGILLHRGLSRKRVLIFNFVSAAAAILGAVITYFLGGLIVDVLPALLALTAGFFIYIAASDLIPEIHEEKRKGFAFLESLLLTGGVVAIWVSTAFLSG